MKYPIIIPVRIDDLPFSDFKITVHRKNAIDFYRDWHKGLRALLVTLDEAKVPRRDSQDIRQALPWLVPDELLPVKLQTQPEILESNWIQIRGIPEVLSTVQVIGRTNEIPRTDENSHLPWFQYRTMLWGL